VRSAGGIDEYALPRSSTATLRAKLRRALARKRPTMDFYLAIRHPALLDIAIRGALASLERGDVAWSFILYENWGVSPNRARPIVLRAARNAPLRAWSELTTALARVGGRAASAMVEKVFLQLKSRRGRSWRDSQRLYDAAAALLTLSPRRTDAAELLVAGMRHKDLLARGAAARAVASIPSRGTGAGKEMIRGALRRLLRHPDPEIFLAVEGWLRDLSRAAFLRGCERLLGTEYGDVAADRLIREGGHSERTKVLRTLQRRRDFSLQITAVSALGKNSPQDLLVRTLRRGLARPSPSDRERTLWLLESVWRAEFAPLARRALIREPDPELRARLRELLEREGLA
jgi:hypothetical protein